MGSKSACARADLAAPACSIRRTRSTVQPRRWHPVVYLEAGPVRFASCDTMREAFDQARSLAASLNARTWTAEPGRASIITTEGGSDE